MTNWASCNLGVSDFIFSLPVVDVALVFGDCGGEGEASAALDLGDGDGILTDTSRTWSVVVDEGNGAALLGSIDHLKEGIGNRDVLFILANHRGVLADDGTCIDHEALVAFSPAMYFLLERTPVIIVELGVLGAHVGHIKTLRHRCSVPAHIHGRRHVSAAVAAVAVFPILGA